MPDQYGTHHGCADRQGRSRDGESWDPKGGAGTKPAEHQGYSGMGPKDLKQSKASAGGSMNERQSNDSPKY